MPFRNGDSNDNAFESLGDPCSLHDRTYAKFNEYPIHCATHRFPISNRLLDDVLATEHTFHQDVSGLLPPINLGSKPDARSPALSWSLESVTQQNATDSKHPAPKTSTKALGSNGISSQQQPRSLHVTSASRKLKRPADWPEAVAQQPRSAQVECGRNCSLGFGRIGCKQLVTPASKPRPRIESSSSGESVEQAHLTSVTSPTKPRLITISPRTPLTVSHPATPQNTCPALASTFSPDTPPETPDLANRYEVDEYDNNPTSPNLKARGPGNLDTTICNLFTPPHSCSPTPFVRTTSSTCFPNPSFQVAPAMTQLDACTVSILEDLEIMLADFPITTFRLSSLVIRRIRSENMTSPRGPHSRCSPYQPRSSYPTSSEIPQNPAADPITVALRTIFPIAHAHNLDSLQATYLTLHYVIDLLSKEFSAASASEGAASPSNTFAKHSRSSSIVSNIPSKAIAMLGLGSPLPSPAMSWFRTVSYELDSGPKTRLENVQLLLEATVKKTLVEIEGRPLGKHDDAMIRAVGEVIKMGERKGSV